MEELDYISDLAIDEDALDVEWLNQPQLFMKYSELLAHAKKILDKKKANLDVVRAVLSNKVRKKPKKYKIEKVSEAAITSLVPQLAEYKKAMGGWIRVKHEVELLGGAVRSFDQRKKALENMVTLHGQKYFAGPRVPRNLKKEVDSTRKRIKQKINKKRRNK